MFESIKVTTKLGNMEYFVDSFITIKISSLRDFIKFVIYGIITI
jgi:hypothetical protein